MISRHLPITGQRARSRFRKHRQFTRLLVERLEDRLLLSAIHGHKFWDFDGGGDQSGEEPGLDGVQIQLLNRNGLPIQSTHTRSIDLDQNGRIDSVTESGLYSFTDVPEGIYTVAEVLQPGLQQTFPHELTFASPRTFAAGDNPIAIAVRDVNLDQVTDLVTLVGDSLVVQPGSESFSFLFDESRPFDIPDSQLLDAVLGNFNGDPFPDVAVTLVAPGGSETVIFLNQGNDQEGGWQGFAIAARHPVGQLPRSIASEDFNGDGNVDLVIGSDGQNQLHILLGDGTGTFSASSSVVLPPPVAGADFTLGFVSAGDINLDGLPDLVTDGPNQLVTVYNLGFNPAGTDWLGFANATSISVPGRPIAVTLTDLNADSSLDVAYLNAAENFVTVLLNNSAGGGPAVFAAAQEYPTGEQPRALEVADINRDASPDLIVGNASSSQMSVHVLLGDGPGEFTEGLAVESGPAVSAVAAGDTNGDGNVDILASRWDGSVDPLSLIANTTGQYTVEVLGPEQTILDIRFGNLAAFDWGDLPDSFGTVITSNGPRHLFGIETPKLGADVTPENDGNPHREALGDGADDGIFFPLPLFPGAESAVTVVPSGSGVISGWMDFNRDGVFDDTPVTAGGEKIVDNVSIGSPTSFPFVVPSDASSLDYSRFRFSTTAGLGPVGGGLPDGEVEDHITLDFGDAPDSYGTTRAKNGPRHRFTPNVYLGSGVDVEQDGRPHREARGDDADGNNDEDGVTFPLPFVPGLQSAVTVEPSTRGFVFGWIDFDGDGVFNETPVSAGGEKVFEGVEVTGPTSLLFEVPDTATDFQFARIRFTSMEEIQLAATGIGSDGTIPDGEVEDYVLLDFGDAPESYGTSLASDGPRHIIRSNVFLGAGSPDIELDGQADSEAFGDDGNSADDEDGVTFLTPLLPGQEAEVEVDPSMAGFLFGWIDFNNDGQFQDNPVATGGERIFSALPVTSAANQRFSFNVPDTADVIPFARFRYTTEEGVMLGPTGVKSDGTVPLGEVEDYALLDFGDAPLKDNGAGKYATLRADDGARHFVSTRFLGTADPVADAPTVDHDGQPHRPARKDINEKGVRFTSPIVPGMTAEIQVTASAAGRLDGFLDWNSDGDWDDLPDRLFTARKLHAGENTLTFAVPDQLEAGIKYLRFRFSEDGGFGPTGLASDGEVEDYALGGIVNSTGDSGDLDLTDGMCDTGDVIQRPSTGTDTEDEPECTLRAAIEQSNAIGAMTSIEFDIPLNDEQFQLATGSFRIKLSEPLPTIGQPVEIDATTQPGYADRPVIEVDGSELAEGAMGLHVTAGDTAVRGLAVYGFTSGNAILIEQAGKNLIESNYLGTDVLGEAAKANKVGVRIIDSADNQVKQNLVSGNSEIGIEIRGNAATGNKLLGNLIGTDREGDEAIPNLKHGVVIREASGNFIGGTGDGEGNVISGNGDNSSFVVGGVVIQGTPEQMGNDARDNIVQGNIIGPNKDGSGSLSTPGARGNAFVGIAVITASHNLIGGATSEARNIISGNLRGIHIAGTADNLGNDARENEIQGNFIGITKDGDQRLGNGDIGVRVVDASANTIGGVVEGAAPRSGAAPGNVISGNRTGVDILGQLRGGSNTATGNLVQGNLIGTTHDGTGVLGNFVGVEIRDASGNTIGGSVAGARNVISGNDDHGVVIQSPEGSPAAGATGNRVQGNYIGVGLGGGRPDGNTDLGNGGNGIQITNARGNLIGGLTAVADSGNPAPGSAPGNVISDNRRSGIDMRGAASEENIIHGNLIGSDASGTLDLGNGEDGVLLLGGPNTTIGGTTAAARNVISGNDLMGIRIVGGATHSNNIQGNLIGTQLNGSSALGNSSHGVFVVASHSNTIGGTENTAAGRCQGACNTVAFNGSLHMQRGHGVVISSGTGNSVRRNSIFDNTGRGIDLEDDSFTLNDLGDEDVGANDLQDYPVATSVNFTGLALGGLLFKSITWTLNSKPDTDFTLDFYANVNPDPSGFGEGQTYLASANVRTNAHGNVSTTRLFPAAAFFISATATEVGTGNTSEFSMVDTDGDALADAWETQGIDLDGDGVVEPWEMGTLDINEDGIPDHVTPTFLPAVPLPGGGSIPAANPFHKDLFVEVDTMVDPGLAQPTQATLHVVATGLPGGNDGFANAPHALVQNPDGKSGVTLHAILSDTNIAHQIFATSGWEEFDAIKQVSFGNPNERAHANRDNILAAKRLAYRYALFGDRRAANAISGVAELPAEHEIAFFGGNDLIISLGGWTTRGGTAAQQQGTFMHELGHTLGLEHGGVDGITYKPNYYSTMNYMWQTPLWFIPLASWSLDYSRVNFGSLNEALLNEAAGVITTTVAADRATAATIAATRNVLMGGRSIVDAISEQLTLSVATRRNAIQALVVPMGGAVDWSRLNLGPFAGAANAANVTALASPAFLPDDDDGFGGTAPNANVVANLSITDDNDITNLPGSEDWSRLRFYFLESAQGSRDGVHNETHDEEEIFSAATVISHDLGDAPAPYPTLVEDDGARHLVRSSQNPLLGWKIDLEGDGQPSAGALGDDGSDGIDLSHDPAPFDSDDEDGVTVHGLLTPGQTAGITVTVQLPEGIVAEARLDAWIDFNADGDWQDPGEQIFQSALVVNGENELELDIPRDAHGGRTYARFRLSTSGGLSPTGEASDGEVEDHLVEIATLPDVDLQLFATNAAEPLSRVTLQYEVRGAPVPQLEVGFFSSDAPRIDSAIAEIGQRVVITDPADLMIGVHSLILDGTDLADALSDADVPFVLAVTDPDNLIAEDDESNNDRHFIGTFQAATVPAPVVIRGRDPGGREFGSADDVIASTANGTEMTLNLNGETRALSLDKISAVVILASGGTDVVEMDGAKPFAVDGGGGDDTLRLVGEQSLDLAAGPALRHIEKLDLRGNSSTTLSLTAAAVLNLSDSTDTLTVIAESLDAIDVGTGWVVAETEVVGGLFFRILSHEDAMLRLSGPWDWSNPVDPLDVDASGSREPLDVLRIINEINARNFSGADGALVAAVDVSPFPGSFFDAAPDGFVVPLDALAIINELNRESDGEGEAFKPLYVISLASRQSLDTRSDQRRHFATGMVEGTPHVCSPSAAVSLPPPNLLRAKTDPATLSARDGEAVDELFAALEFLCENLGERNLDELIQQLASAGT